MVLVLFCSGFLFASPVLTHEEATKRIYNYLLVRDSLRAVKAGKEALSAFPHSKNVRTALFEALCKNGNETEALALWEESFDLFQDGQINRNMLETLAWGVLNKAESSSQLNIQLHALLGAAFTRDAKAVPLLMQQLHSSNALIRTVAIKLSALFGDAALKKEIERLLREERVWYVRLEVIRAVGALHLQELQSELKEIIADTKTMAEEKAAAMSALVAMYDQVDRQEIYNLVKSNRAGLRQLGCEVITYLNLYEHLDLLIPLLQDTSSDVRVSALSTLALLRVKKIGDTSVLQLLQKCVEDDSPEVCITSAYALLLLESKLGEEYMQKWLTSDNPSWRRMASAATAASGVYGVKLSLKQLKEAKDPYVKANLAMGLLAQRLYLKPACDVLYEILTKDKTLWMWESSAHSLFRSLAPSQVKHIEQIPHYPAVVDQLVRLDLLNMLSIVRYCHAQEAVKEFLQTRSWGVTGAAAATLLQEGDESALDTVKSLLQDQDENIRLQAALIMTLVGNDVAAAKILEEIYPHVEREMKVHILEAIAHVGDPQSIAFLLTILKEPFQLLRCIAASAIIQCLY